MPRAVPTDKVIANAAALGIGRIRLAFMINRSAPYAQTPGLFRFEDYVFLCQGDQAVSITHKSLPVYATQTFVCEDCNDDKGFCLTCGSTGHVTQRVMIYSGHAMEGNNGNQRVEKTGSQKHSWSGVRRPVYGSA